MSHSKLCGSKYLSPNKYIICGIIYRKDNSPEVSQTYFEETVEKFALNNNTLYRMGDFNVDLLKCETSTSVTIFITPIELLSYCNS